MSKEEKMTEAETRECISLAERAIRHQLRELLLQMADFSLKTNQSAKSEDLKIGNKGGALTALNAQISERLALLEFIALLDLEGQNKTTNIRVELERHHARITRSLERSAAEVSARASRMIQTTLESRDKGKAVPLGERARTLMAGDNARHLKDMVLLGFIQQFDIVSRSARRNDL